MARMCTLIVGRDVLGPDTTILAANRDEDPGRPTDPPGILCRSPRVIGGRDRVAGGTWLAVRHGAAVAMLNRRPDGATIAPTRSRGLLALDIACAPVFDAPGTTASAAGTLDRCARSAAAAAFEADDYAPFSMLFATHDRAWVLAWNGVSRTIDLPAGWSVLTHAELNDDTEPRTRRLRRELSGFTPDSPGAAENRLRELLAAHDAPAVCLHDVRMPTLSSSIVVLAAGSVRYVHSDGRPCTGVWTDRSDLLYASDGEAEAG